MSRSLSSQKILEPDVLELQAKLFRGFADLSRLSILEVLKDGPCAVGEIVAATGLSQPNISNHLRCLSECGLVTSERQGRFIHYKLSDARIASLLEVAEQLLETHVCGIDRCKNY